MGNGSTFHKSNMSIIDKFQKKINTFVGFFNKKFFLSFLLMFSFGIFSFSAGFLFSENQKKIKDSNLFLVSRDDVKDAWFLKDGENFNYFASVNGKNFYSKNCKAGNRIHQKNRIYFESISEAESLGYSFSKSCS